MANKLKKCRNCKEFTPVSDGCQHPIGYFCSQDCVMKFVIGKNEAKFKKEQTKLRKERVASHKAAKDAVTTRAEWLAKLQAKFNAYIRQRDIHDGCISCDKPATWHGQWHASHYYPRSTASAIRFNTWNVHKSCSVCNSHLSGNIGEYTPRIIDKIGQQRFDCLFENKTNLRTYDIDQIRRGIKLVNRAMKRLKKKQNRLQ